MILIDGKYEIPGLSVKSLAIIKGDALTYSIGAASILAKEFRDGLMRDFDKLYPNWNFKTHVGYGTALHRQRLATFGPCALHRESFAPVAALINSCRSEAGGGPQQHEVALAA